MASSDSEQKGGFPAWMLLLLAALGVPFAAMRTASSIATSDAVEASAGESTPPPRANELDAHCFDRWNTTLTEGAFGAWERPRTLSGPAAEEDDPWRQSLLVVKDELSARGIDVRVYVTTIPDPIDSGQAYAFQTHLQAARLGIEEQLSGLAKYFRTSEWLPWYETLPDDREMSMECRRTTPGLTVFRGADRQDVTLLLLVGESPTGGVHPVAMERALSAAHDLESTIIGAPESGLTLRILGPTFSGSASSVRRALADFGKPDALATEPWRVSIISGTATGPNLRDDFVSAPALGHLNVEFWTTTVPEEVLQCRYLLFLHYWLGVGPRGSTTLQEVALLQESGTEFGAGTVIEAAVTGDLELARGDRPCRYEPGVRATFPANIAALRDAYEAMDSSSGTARLVARRTSLNASLRELHPAPGIASEPSPRALFASDAALSRTIAALQRQGVRHVGIQATDIADAIFLSRKIRDIAPDVRVAVFQSDTLLLHANFRRSLLGSLVVTPYPFLGASELDFDRPGQTFRPIENGSAQGVFNAMLALRGAEADELLEYSLRREGVARAPRYEILPVWISAVGLNGFVPLTVMPSVLRETRSALVDSPVYPGLDAPPLAHQFVGDEGRFPGVPVVGDRDSWRPPIERLHSRKAGRFSLRAPPRWWGVLTLLACVAFLADGASQRSQRQRLDRGELPREVGRTHERQVDLVALRIKWHLYASIRTWLGALTVGYLWYWTFAGRGGQVLDPYLFFGGVGFAWLVLSALRASWRFASDLVAFWLARADQTIPKEPVDANFLDRFAIWTGIALPDRPIALARVTQFQATILGVLVVGLATVVTWAHVMAISAAHHVLDGQQSASEWARTLMAERTLTLVGGVSVAAPTLVLVGVFYLWTVSRMSCLGLVHGLSRMTPPDKVPDFVSTPIRMILEPSFHLGAPSGPDKDQTDTALTKIERGAVNAIARPMTGVYYVLTWLGVLVLPLVLFWSASPATLERDLNCPLVLLLYLAYVVVACSLLQLLQYWCSVELLLKGVFQHWLGRAFGRVAPFVQDSVDEQVSKTPSDLLRLAECAEEYSKLNRWARKPGNRVAAPFLATLRTTATRLARLREDALDSIRNPDRAVRFEKEAQLGAELVASAAQLVLIVEQERASWSRPRLPSGQSETYPKEDMTWISDVESFAATVVAVLINRHVRQLQYFAYPLLVSTILIMSAVLSYPFEPQRLMTTFVWALVVLSVFGVVWIYLQFDRNSLLSRIASTQPGRVTASSSLVFRLLTWGAAPILTALAADYPDLFNSLFTWIEPIAPWRRGP